MKNFTLLFLLVFLGTTGFLYSQGTWTMQTVPVTTDINSISAVDNNVCWACGPAATGGAATILRTTNGGANWTIARGDIPNNTNLYNLFAIDANNCWVGADDGSVYKTTNGGVNWIFVSMPAPQTAFIDAIHFFTPQIGFIMGDPAGGTWCYYWTTNGGVNWTFGPAPTAPGTEAGWNNSYCALDTGHIWWGTNNSKIYRGGFRSNFVSAATPTAYSFGVSFFNVNTGVAIMVNSSAAPQPTLRSTDGGQTWTSTSFTPPNVPYGLKAVAGTQYAWICTGGTQTAPGAIYRTTNGGTSWTQQTTSLPAGKSFYCISMVSVNKGWAGTGTAVTNGTNGGIFVYTDNIISVNEPKSNVPADFVLEQNYPNPFNPTTTIKFNIPKSVFVTLKIYDVLGNEVLNVVEDNLSAGEYVKTVDFSKLSSGIYYYTLNAGDFSSTRKMMFIK